MVKVGSGIVVSLVLHLYLLLILGWPEELLKVPVVEHFESFCQVPSEVAALWAGQQEAWGSRIRPSSCAFLQSTPGSAAS